MRGAVETALDGFGYKYRFNQQINLAASGASGMDAGAVSVYVTAY